MAWTNPKTWNAGETVTHTELNTHIRDNLDFLHSKDHCSAYQTTNQSVADATWENITFDAEHFDSNSMHSAGSDPARIKCNSDGLYLCVFKVSFDTNTTGTRRAQIRENAAGSSSGGTARGVWTAPALASVDTTVSGARLLRLVDTDYIEVFAYQDSGGALDVTSGSAATWLQLMQLAG